MQHKTLVQMSSLILGLIFSPGASAWNSHYLVTERALNHPSMGFLSEKLSPEHLSQFLVSEQQNLKTLFSDYYDWLKKKGSKRFKRMEFRIEDSPVRSFLLAARLNPQTQFFNFVRQLPQEASSPAYFDFHKVSPFETAAHFFLEPAGQNPSAREVLYTYSDEPDWGMDIELWDYPEYGYGEIPYGELKGTASQAPFHMQFANEDLLMKQFAPEIVEGGMVVDRIELARRLSQLAFSSGHRYWGYRFAGWAFHYIQDLTQPYHSKSIPSADWKFYLQFLLSSDKAKFKSEATGLAKNRHYAYEDLVGFSLGKSYIEGSLLFQRLAQFLSSGAASYSAASVGKLYKTAGKKAAKHAKAIDQAVVQAFGPRRTEDPSYDISSDPDYDIAKVIPELDPEDAEALVVETGVDFENAGAATRTMILLLTEGLRVQSR